MTAALLRLVSRLPLAVLYPLAAVLYVLVYRVMRFSRDVVYANLSNAFPDKPRAEIERLASGFYRNFCDVVVEMLKSLTMSTDELSRRVMFSGEEVLLDHLRNGRPVLAATAHQSNVEWLVLAACARFGFPVEAIYRPLRSAVTERLLTSTYARFGGTLIPDRSVVKEIMRRHAESRIVFIVPDQSPNLGDDQYWTTFLNQETGFYLAPEVIAKFARYPVLFLGMKRVRRGYYEATVTALAEPPYGDQSHDLVERYVRAVETQILQQPTDWLWLHKRWKHRKPLYG